MKKKTIFKEFYPELKENIITDNNWNIVRSDYYSYLGYIKNNIIIGINKGVITLDHMKQYCKNVDKLIQEKCKSNKKLIVLEDLTQITHVESNARNFYREFYIKKDKVMKALIFFGANYLLRFSINVGKLFAPNPIKVKICKDIDTAMSLAKELRKQAAKNTKKNNRSLIIPPENLKKSSKDKWLIKFEEYTATFEIIDEDILLISGQGTLDDIDIADYLKALKYMISKVPQSKTGYYRIGNYTQLSSISWRSRKLFTKFLVEMQKQFSCLCGITYGASLTLKTEVKLYQSLYPYKMMFCDTLDEALQIIENQKTQKILHKKEHIKKIKPSIKKKKNKPHTLDDYNEELLQLLGSISWDPLDTSCKINIEEKHPFKEVIRAIEILKTDIFTLLNEKMDKENELKKAKTEAEIASKAKEEFLARMSHEIRTPLNAIIGMTDIMLETNLSEEQQEFMSTLKVSGNSLLSLVNGVLDFSKIEAGKMDLKYKEFNLRSTIEEIAEMLSPRAFKEKIEFITLIHHDVPEKVLGDQGRLKQVLLNLVNNSLKFTNQGKILIVVMIDQEFEIDEELSIIFFVRDTGVGIPQKYRDKIFKPFYQIDTSTTRNFEGTGLGLIICKKLVSMMGGTIDYMSKVNKGTTFYFNIKYKKTKMQKKVKTYNFKNINTLILTNNYSQFRVFEEYLIPSGMVVYNASYNNDILKKLRMVFTEDNTNDFIFIDCYFTKRKAEEMHEIIKELAPRIKSRIVILTNKLNLENIHILIEMDQIDYLVKPIKYSDLIHMIQNKMRKQKSTKKRIKQIKPKMKKAKILLVEDNKINQRLMEIFIKRMNYSCEVANDGLEAIDILKKKKYDLIIMDIQMPKIDGFETTDLIRKMNIQTPIIALTADVTKETKLKCRHSGMNNYISKPIKKNLLLEIIKKYTSN